VVRISSPKIFSESPLDFFYLLKTETWIAGRTMTCRVREDNRVGIMNMSIGFLLGAAGSAQTSLFNESFRKMTYCRKEFLSEGNKFCDIIYYIQLRFRRRYFVCGIVFTESV